jgi:hypothetical protein
MMILASLRKNSSLLFRKKKLAFLHVPKTGGTYLAQRETDQQPVLPVRYLGHYYVVDRNGVINPLYYAHSPQYYDRTIRLRDIRQYMIISTVRNIFSWLVSYAWHAGGWNPEYMDPNHYDYAAANKSFNYLLNTIANREGMWPNRKFIFCQFFCNNGQLIVDWINRNENLDKDLEMLANKYNFPFARRERQRVGHGVDYRTYYTDELIDLVYKTWGRELDLFGYKFDEPKPGSNSYHQAIDTENKNRIRYFLESDELKVDNEIIKR